MTKAWSEMTNLEREAYNAGAALKDKLLFDTGKGCSVCGHVPVVNVDGTYWLCGGCVSEKLPLRPEELRWTLHDHEKDGPLGSFLTGQPGKPIYAIDERGINSGPYRIWKLDLPTLPDMNVEK